MNAPQAPTPPDPYKIADYQAQLNRDAAISQQGLNMVNQVTPFGTLRYAPNPKAYLGHGAMYTAYTQLSPAMQSLFNVYLANARTSAEIAKH
jgi:hypothetical protein